MTEGDRNRPVRVYLAGPMTGFPEYNFPAFREATAKLRQEGYSVTSPVEADEIEDGFDGIGDCPHAHEVYMKRDLPLVLKCDEVRVLDGWFDSKGAVAEVLVATLAGIPVRLVGGSAVQVTVSLLTLRLFNLINPSGVAADADPYLVGPLYTPPSQVPTPISEVAPGIPAVPTTWEQALDAVLHEMRVIMVERQKKYGPNNIKQQGLLGVLTRAMDDKIERIKGALNGKVVRGKVVLDPIINGSEDNDTFDDGCLDAANYLGPIMLMLKRGWWDLPHE